MKIKIEVKLYQDQKVNYSVEEVTYCSVRRELDLPVPLKEFKAKSLDAIAECRQEIIEAFNRLVEAERVAAEKAAETVEAQ